MNALRIRLTVFIALLLVVAAMLLTWLTLQRFERNIIPEMARTSRTVGESVFAVFERAHQHGIALPDMFGANEFLDEAMREHAGLAYLYVADDKGHVLFRNSGSAARAALSTTCDVDGTTLRGEHFHTCMRMPLSSGAWATLHLGRPASFVTERMRAILYDLLAVLVVSGLITVELLRFTLTFVFATPMTATQILLSKVRERDFSYRLPHERLGGIAQLGRSFNLTVEALNRRVQALRQRWGATALAEHPGYQHLIGHNRFGDPGKPNVIECAAVDHIRWPFFLLIFADSLSLSFFPVYAGQFYTDIGGLSRELVVGLPISIFMFTWALSMPWVGTWSDKVGSRKAFIVGAGITTLGLLLTATATSLVQLLVWRSMTAVGYGLAFITTQSYISANTPPSQRTKAMATFISTFFAGSLSGSAIGGILADRIGYAPTILMSGLLSATAALVVLNFIHGSDAAATPRQPPGMKEFKRLLSNPRFVLVTFFAAVPSKIALSGFLYYTVPLYLKLLGNSQSTTGRIIMAYGLAIIVLSPLIANLADRIGKLRWFVGLGGFLSAAAMLSLTSFDSLTGVLISTTLLGIAHAIGVSPQLSLINECCRELVQEMGAGTTTGIFRLIERLGNVLGPILAGLLIAHFGFSGAFVGIGAIVMSCALVFMLSLQWLESGKNASTQTKPL
ncbi:MFS transporter [Mitsuaria sp. WAJ17]|uniref:MFS transporter n=1 Tax=Mitsuaria sp. WAJ17 TaxID=2761452 RepID=UPI0016036230|nr:MFS transporter [Mitsuaria sp. WAJ17]MBB2484683.1 MFS transporter [Mitsuaria sp. WAJ17]